MVQSTTATQPTLKLPNNHTTGNIIDNSSTDVYKDLSLRITLRRVPLHETATKLSDNYKFGEKRRNESNQIPFL